METTNDCSEQLAMTDLEMIVGGAAGVYVSLGTNAAGNGSSDTLTLGSDGLRSYHSEANGYGFGAGAGVAGGVYSTDSPDGADFWAGQGQTFTLQADDFAAVGVEAHVNEHGSAAGLNAGWGTPGIGFSVSDTYTTETEPGRDVPVNIGDGLDHSTEMNEQPALNDWSSAFGDHELGTGHHNYDGEPTPSPAAPADGGFEGTIPSGDDGAGDYGGPADDFGSYVGDTSDGGVADYAASDFGSSDGGAGGSDYGGGDYGGGDYGGGDYGGSDVGGSDFGGSDFGGSDAGGFA